MVPGAFDHHRSLFRLHPVRTEIMMAKSETTFPFFNTGATAMSRGRHHYGTGHASTAGQLVRQSRNHNPNFNKVLPHTMEKLVSEGLFAPAGLDSDGHTTR